MLAAGTRALPAHSVSSRLPAARALLLTARAILKPQSSRGGNESPIRQRRPRGHAGVTMMAVRVYRAFKSHAHVLRLHYYEQHAPARHACVPCRPMCTTHTRTEHQQRSKHLQAPPHCHVTNSMGALCMAWARTPNVHLRHAVVYSSVWGRGLGGGCPQPGGRGGGMQVREPKGQAPARQAQLECPPPPHTHTMTQRSMCTATSPAM